jgi:hypothetical protein
MAFEVIYKALAQAEVAEAFEWYEQERARHLHTNPGVR